MAADRTVALRKAYLFVFNRFAVGRSEVAAHLGVEPAAAGRILARLRDVHLVDNTDVNEEAQGMLRRGQYKELVWQCWKGQDDYSEEEANEHFNQALGLPAGTPFQTSSKALKSTPQVNENQESTMARTTTSKAPARRTAKAPVVTVTSNGGKRHDDTKLTPQVLKALAAGEKLGAIAESLGITAGKAAFLVMKHEVAENPKLRITFKSDEDLAVKVVKARADGLSWGQIAARTGVGEGKLKTLGDEAGAPRQLEGRGGRGYIKEEATPKTASKRAAAAPKATPAATKAPARKTTKAAPKVGVARRTRRVAANPS